MTRQLTAVSLFAGVGGFDIALERAGVKVVATCEIDDKARGVLAHRYPDTAHFTDVQEVKGEQLINAGFDPENGIIVGGFPCQDLSVAGRRAGLAGARSGLFWEICRLLDETKARYFILENVPGLLSSNGGRDLGTVIGALVERGYGVAYRILDAQHFGVPQRRRRVFIVGSLGGHWQTPSEILALAEGRGRYLAESIAKGKNSSTSTSEGTGSSGDTVGTLLARDYKGPSSDDATAGKLIVGAFRKSKRAQTDTDYETWVETDTTNTLNAFDVGDTRATEIVFTQNQREEVRDLNGVAAALSAGGGSHQTNYIAALHNETCTECGNDDSTEDQSYCMDCLEDGAKEANEAALAYDEFNDSISDVHHTLRAGTKQSTGVLTSTVRRLTPTECERLQGFPDGWTAEYFDFKKNAVLPAPDSARYKQMGNAVAVPVVEWIAHRIAAIHKDGDR